MILRFLKPLSFITLFTLSTVLSAQIKEKETVLLSTGLDTLTLKGVDKMDSGRVNGVIMSAEEAIKFLQARQRTRYWKNPDDTLRSYLGQLIYYATHDPVNVVTRHIEAYPFDSLRVSWESFYKWDTIRFAIPAVPATDSVSEDMIMKAVTGHDTIAMSDKGRVTEALSKRGRRIFIDNDTLVLVLIDTLRDVSPEFARFPFTGYSHPLIGDSIEAAVQELLKVVYSRDSSLIYLTGSGNADIPLWLNSRAETYSRFWLRNDYDDSVTVWVGNQGRNTLGLFLESNIQFRRPVKSYTIVDASMNVQAVDNRTLRDVRTIYVKPNYWRYHSEASFIFNQAYLSNWAKGGESSISGVLDLTGNANYNNTVKKLVWTNQGRLKHGFVKPQEKSIRRNLDLFEVNSKLNTKAFGRFDFSSTAQFKTQFAKGYDYKTSDTIPVSRFLSPAIITIGMGLDYKPNKETSINFAPLSYKGTFVSDTAMIDQRKYGIEADRKARHEPGASLTVNHKFSPVKNISVSNRVQLFTNYIDSPQNVDIDWEMIATMSLNWFTDVRLNTHFIFDDDTKTTFKDKSGNLVLGDDGKPKKTARIQFKEIIGFSFIFRF
jgi:hypothetical protein